MPFLKTVAIILIAAIANPICCCFAGISSEVEASLQHGCCSTEDGQRESSQQHATDECPHQLEKASKISQSGDLADSLAKSLLHFPTVRPSFEAQCGTALFASARLPVGKGEKALPIAAIAQAYCVYLL